VHQLFLLKSDFFKAQVNTICHVDDDMAAATQQ
jgi:hypothetical protein